MGYHRAGFEVIGMDIKPQPRYPFEFIQGDALKPPVRLEDFDAIHASPPCQRYTTGGIVDSSRHPDLIGSVRQLLETTSVPWVIENVPESPLRSDLLLCGSMFNLPLRRHRLFESNCDIFALRPQCEHSRRIVGVYGNMQGQRGGYWAFKKKQMLPGTKQTWRQAMGIDWMEPRELSQAIPPAYTEFIGDQLLQVLHG